MGREGKSRAVEHSVPTPQCPSPSLMQCEPANWAKHGASSRPGAPDLLRGWACLTTEVSKHPVKSQRSLPGQRGRRAQHKLGKLSKQESGRVTGASLSTLGWRKEGDKSKQEIKAEVPVATTGYTNRGNVFMGRRTPEFQSGLFHWLGQMSSLLGALASSFAEWRWGALSLIQWPPWCSDSECMISAPPNSTERPGRWQAGDGSSGRKNTVPGCRDVQCGIRTKSRHIRGWSNMVKELGASTIPQVWIRILTPTLCDHMAFPSLGFLMRLF